MHRLLHHADDARGPGIGGHFSHRIEQVLLLQIGNLLLTANEVHFGIAPVAAVFGGKDIGIHRLMGAVESPKTEMNDARNQLAAIVRRKRCPGV